MSISNPSRLAGRPNAPYSAEEELKLNTGTTPTAAQAQDGAQAQKPTMTLDQIARGLGIRATNVPAGVSDVTPSDAMTFKNEAGEDVSFAQVMKNVHGFLTAASVMESVGKISGVTETFNPVEAAIAYMRNAKGQPAEQSLAALNNDLVKFSVMGFQIGTQRDRETMAQLDRLVGDLSTSLTKNREMKDATAVFELGTRKLPEGVPYLVIAGVKEALNWVYNELDFNEEVIQFLKTEIPATAGWTDEHWNYLRNFKNEVKKLEITGLPDGSIYTGGPIMKVKGPAIIAEFIESAVMARVSAMTHKATAVAMVLEVFLGKFSELGMRRPSAADTLTADIRACSVVADVPTSLVLAQYLHNIKAIGTMEHSAILLNGTEAETLFFVQWFLMYGKFSAALVDSRTPKEGVQAVIEAQKIINALRPTLEKDPAYAHITSWEIPAIRLDSGDLKAQVVEFRQMLDEAGMQSTEIFIMDGMHHEKLKKIIYNKDGSTVKVDSTGAGESIRFPVAIDDDGNEYHWLPQMIYKAARLFYGDDVIDMMKLSATPEKATTPTRSLHRVYDAEHKMVRDVAGLELPDGSFAVPEAPPGGRVAQRLQALAKDGVVQADFALPAQAYWKKTRARFAQEAAALPTTWQERDALRAAGKPYGIPFNQSPELVDAIIAYAEDAGRGDEFRKFFEAQVGR